MPRRLAGHACERPRFFCVGVRNFGTAIGNCCGRKTVSALIGGDFSMEEGLTQALVFPGQGAQAVGMGKAVADAYPAARSVYQEVDEALGEKLSATIWEGSQDTLSLTVNAQPALMATSIAVLKALESEGFALGSIRFMAGHSLGEYTALCAAGSISIAETAQLLRTRGKAMQEAVPVGEGAMAALLGLNISEVESVASEASAGGVCDVANDNDPKQVVVSGHCLPVERAIEIAASRGARRAVKLPTSAPFHCRLMSPAAARMQSVLAEMTISQPRTKVIANVTARPAGSAEDMAMLLVKQVTGRVRWRETVLWMAEQGVTSALEVGVGNALTGMMRRTASAISCVPCGTPAQLQAAVSAMEN